MTPAICPGRFDPDGFEPFRAELLLGETAFVEDRAVDVVGEVGQRRFGVGAGQADGPDKTVETESWAFSRSGMAASGKLRRAAAKSMMKQRGRSVCAEEMLLRQHQSAWSAFPPFIDRAANARPEARGVVHTRGSTAMCKTESALGLFSVSLIMGG
jgi:hypothetical protein